MTQKEIARLVGVSHVAVSHALHRPRQSRISEEKQVEIRRVARDLGYLPRNLTTRTIGLVMPVGSVHLEITSTIISLANEVLRNRGYRLALVAYDEQGPELDDYLLDQKSADGALLTDVLPTGSHLIAPDLPRVLMSDADEKQLPNNVDQVALDTRGSMEVIVSYLASLGHERIGLVASVIADPFDNHLREGLRSSLKAHGLPLKSSYVVEVTRDGRTAEPLLNCLSQKGAAHRHHRRERSACRPGLNALQWAGYKVPGAGQCRLLYRQ